MKFNVNTKTIIYGISFFVLLVIFGLSIYFSSSGNGNSELEVQILEGTVVSANEGLFTVVDDSETEYTFNDEEVDTLEGDEIVIKYTGKLDESKDIQDVVIVDYVSMAVSKNDDEKVLPTKYNDKGIFSDYYDMAYKKLKEMSLDEKIGQLLLVRYPDSDGVGVLKKYGFGGYVFFGKDFTNKTKDEVQKMMKELQDVSKIPILTATDEEGGDVVRVSNNSKLASEKFKSSSEIYKEGGLTAIADDTKNKSKLLEELGINLNLAPVVDVSTSAGDYMYSRALKENAEITSQYAKTVIEASKGTGVSYTLKHFPGYGNNADTHSSSATDSRSLEDIKKNDLPPFEAGIKAGAEAVLVSHNTVTSIDPNNPASLSSKVHDLLRNDLGFTGVIMTDDLAMGATSSIGDAVVKAVMAGNNLIMVTDYESSYNALKKAVGDGTISEDDIDNLIFKVIAWKYYKGLMLKGQK